VWHQRARTFYYAYENREVLAFILDKTILEIAKFSLKMRGEKNVGVDNI
jgi:hypothetical protein